MMLTEQEHKALRSILLKTKPTKQYAKKFNDIKLTYMRTGAITTAQFDLIIAAHSVAVRNGVAQRKQRV